MKQKTHIKLNLHETSGILRALIPDFVFKIVRIEKNRSNVISSFSFRSKYNLEFLMIRRENLFIEWKLSQIES